MSKIIAIVMLVLATLCAVLIVALAPDAFENGGYLHHACVHIGTVALTLMFTLAVRELVRTEGRA
jgi:low temperature requirement protein LtrA